MRGFLGHYRVTVVTPSGTVTKEMELRAGGGNRVRVTVP